jgi:undecaprenyl-diphosphatase
MVPLWLQGFVLGVVQGLSEFMPISSDGHLVLVPFLLGWKQPSLSFIVALHLGTLAAVLLYFRRDLLAMLTAVTRWSDEPEARLYRRLVVLLAAGSVPVALLGLLLKERIEQVFASPLIAPALLFVTAAFLVAGEKARDRRVARAVVATGDAEASVNAGSPALSNTATATEARMQLAVGRDEQDATGDTLADMSVQQAIVIGTLQTVALLPGISRSGSTIPAGMFTGLTREAATRFSFLLSIPALVGAGLLNISELAAASDYSGLEIITGVVAAFLSGYAAIRWLVSFVARERLTGFAWYCAAAGVIGLLGTALRAA